LLGTLADEFGPDRLAPVAFHVDYFDDPWKDPFSSPLHSRRELEYSRIYERERGLKKPGYLYLTPLMMVNGRVPMVGSNGDAPARARTAIREALAKPPEVTIGATPAEDGRRLVVEVAPRGAGLAGKRVLIEMITTEDGLENDVGDGELKGKRYRARHVARGYAVEPVQLPKARAAPARVEFPVERPAGSDPARLALIVLAQDEATGRVFQAVRLPWPGP
jgi:hypothetical protein